MTPINIKKNFKFIFLTILEVKIKYRSTRWFWDMGRFKILDAKKGNWLLHIHFTICCLKSSNTLLYSFRKDHTHWTLWRIETLQFDLNFHNNIPRWRCIVRKLSRTVMNAHQTAAAFHKPWVCGKKPDDSYVLDTIAYCAGKP